LVKQGPDDLVSAALDTIGATGAVTYGRQQR
jgi:hypothetical protein